MRYLDQKYMYLEQHQFDYQEFQPIAVCDETDEAMEKLIEKKRQSFIDVNRLLYADEGEWVNPYDEMIDMLKSGECSFTEVAHMNADSNEIQIASSYEEAMEMLEKDKSLFEANYRNQLPFSRQEAVQTFEHLALLRRKKYQSHPLLKGVNPTWLGYGFLPEKIYESLWKECLSMQKECTARKEKWLRLMQNVPDFTSQFAQLGTAIVLSFAQKDKVCHLELVGQNGSILTIVASGVTGVKMPKSPIKDSIFRYCELVLGNPHELSFLLETDTETYEELTIDCSQIEVSKEQS